VSDILLQVRAGIPKLCAAGYASLSIYVYELFFQKATKLLRNVVIQLFGPKYLTNGNVRYFFWPRGAVKNYRSTRGAVNRESLRTAGSGHKHR